MRVQSPIAGAMSGSAGGLVFQHYHGRTYGRALPAIFHYGPTPAQAISQDKYYNVRKQVLSAYRELKPYIPKWQKKQVNTFNSLSSGIFKALGTFSTTGQPAEPSKIGFDFYNRLKVEPGAYTISVKDNSYYLKFDEIHCSAKVDFTPVLAHMLYLDPTAQLVQYALTNYQLKDTTFIIHIDASKSRSQAFDIYLALSNRNFFSNFFF